MNLEKYERLVFENLDNLTEGQLKKLYGDLNKKVKQDSFDVFIDYNKQDTNIVSRLDKKLNFIQLALTVAHISKSSPNDIFGTVKPWDNMLYANLHNKNIQIPPNKSAKKEKYIGGFVKEPHVGRHNWVISVDLTSLYPSIIMMLNMSPEKLMRVSKKDVEIIIKKMIDMEYDTSLAHEDGYTISANGSMYSKDGIGIIPEAMSTLFNTRKSVKNEMKVVKNELEELKNKREKLLNEKMDC